MPLWKNKKILIATAILVAVCLSFTLLIPDHRIDYSADVKPIFNKKCITCHGGVKKQSGFSLLFRSDALANTK
jgi:hypothetical protein